MKSYDKIPENDSILLDLPFREGVGVKTFDHAKPHHADIDLINTPTWGALASGLGVLSFAGSGAGNEYIELDNAASADLNFIAGDYSYGAWFNWTPGPEDSQLLIGRYEINVSGWEIYLTLAGGIHYITQRHSHAGTLVGGNPRSAVYSINWTPGEWHFFSTSRTGGGLAQHYRNGVAVETVGDNLVDPETNNSDLVIGVRYTKDANYFKGPMWRPRVWDRILTAAEWLNIFEREQDFFGV